MVFFLLERNPLGGPHRTGSNFVCGVVLFPVYSFCVRFFCFLCLSFVSAQAVQKNVCPKITDSHICVVFSAACSTDLPRKMAWCACGASDRLHYYVFPFVLYTDEQSAV